MFADNWHPEWYRKLLFQEGLCKMEHTKGKWIIGVGCRIRDEHDNSIALCAGDASHFDWKTNEANANRICKCVNGWDERGELIAKTSGENEQLRTDILIAEGQRDALLEAHKDIQTYEEARRKMASNAPLPDSVVCKLAKEAIALCSK